MSSVGTVILTRWERKERLGHGGVSQIAAELGVDQGFVSRVLHGKDRNARVEEAIAKRVVRSRKERAFPPKETAA